MKPLEHLDVILWGPQAPMWAVWKGGLQGKMWDSGGLGQGGWDMGCEQDFFFFSN